MSFPSVINFTSSFGWGADGLEYRLSSTTSTSAFYELFKTSDGSTSTESTEKGIEIRDETGSTKAYSNTAANNNDPNTLECDGVTAASVTLVSGQLLKLYDGSSLKASFTVLSNMLWPVSGGGGGTSGTSKKVFCNFW